MSMETNWLMTLLYNMDKKELIEQINLLSKKNSGFNFSLATELFALVKKRFDYSEVFSEAAFADSQFLKFIKFRFCCEMKQTNLAIEILSGLIKEVTTDKEWLLLELAKLLVRNNDNEQASAILNQAVMLRPQYDFYLKSEKLVTKIRLTTSLVFKRKIKLAFLANSTGDFVGTVLKTVLLAYGVDCEIYVPNFGAYRQDIIDNNSDLYKFAPDFVVILPNFLDYFDYTLTEFDHKSIAAEFEEYQQMILRNIDTKIVQCGFTAGETGAWGYIEDAKTDAKGSTVRKINEILSRSALKSVCYFDMQRFAGQTGVALFSAEQWYNYRQFPSFNALPELAFALSSIIVSNLGLSAKAIVLDLDNTLWGGIIGEDGLAGIRLGAPFADGEAYVVFQKYLLALKQRGIFLAVCSKNNYEDAIMPFEKHSAMILRLSDILVFKANWQDKATNIIQIAGELAIGLDAIIFIDDNPIERQLVKQLLPEAVVPECGDKPWEMLDALRRTGLIENFNVTHEDLTRHGKYAAEISRKKMFNSATCDMEIFYKDLDMKAKARSVDMVNAARVTQLINKTNQFNLTTRRYSEAQIIRMMDDDSYLLRCYELSDRYGDYGVVGVAIIIKSVEGYVIDSFLMSCRVLGRKMEDFIMADIIASARQENVQLLFGEYCKTSKNEQVEELYVRFGFGRMIGRDNCFTLSLQDGLERLDFNIRAV